ncbi:MAG: hypothetical protein Q9222_004326 [Ikaeria aurantiellina]
MSSTTEESDWETTIIPLSRRPSSNGQSNSLPRPVLPTARATIGPGQSVFAVAAPNGHEVRNAFPPPPIPQPPPPHVNQPYFPPNPPIPVPAVATPANPVTRVIQENASYSSPYGMPPSRDVTQQAPAIPTDPPQQYSTPASRSIRGVKSGARRARASRTPRIKIETPDTAPALADTPVGSRGSGRGRARGTRANRGGRPRGSRAGATSSRGNKRRKLDEEEKDDSDVSEIITPLPTQSRSGRKITHANNFSPVVIDLEEQPTPSVPAIAVKPNVSVVDDRMAGKQRRKKSVSRPGEASVCKNCGRGHSPASNMIVFCDGCNGPWHQFCHDPPISPEVIRIEEQEWYCANCQVLREEKAVVDGKVGAETLSIVEKRHYLQSLPSAHLVSLLLHATVLHPTLPIFATPSGGLPPERPKRPITHFIDPTAPVEEEDESYDLYPDSETLPYPKAGNGVPIPPESASLALLIDEDTKVYSHIWDWHRNGDDNNLAIHQRLDEIQDTGFQ